jgi:flagellar protein FlaG
MESIMATDPISGLSNTANAAPAQPVHSDRGLSPTPSAVNANANVKTVQPLAAQPTMEQVTEAIKKVQEAISPVAQDLQFSVDKDNGTIIIKLLDTKTQTVLKQIPTEQALDISKALDKLQGLLIKHQA